MPNRAPKFECSPLMGVYRFRHKIGGRTAWYSVNALGDIADLRVVRDDETEAAVVDSLAKAIGLKVSSLTLVRDLSSESVQAERALLVHAARAQRSVVPLQFPRR